MSRGRWCSMSHHSVSGRHYSSSVRFSDPSGRRLHAGKYPKSMSSVYAGLSRSSSLTTGRTNLKVSLSSLSKVLMINKTQKKNKTNPKTNTKTVETRCSASYNFKNLSNLRSLKILRKNSYRFVVEKK